MTEKTYNTIHDFLNDASFKNWAFNSQLSDVSFWNTWLQDNPSKRSIAYEAKDVLLGINFKKSTPSEEKINSEWNILESKLKIIQNKKKKEKKSKALKAFLSYKMVASVLILISIGIFSYEQFSLVTHKTTYGEVFELKLKDGTLVTLNSNSSLSYKKNNPRKVWLHGEAYFKVNKKRSTKAKFSVHTDDLVVEVFGTQFNVKSSSEQTNVYLEEGNILLNLNNGTSKQMQPGNYIEYSSEDRKILVDRNSVSNEEQTSWKNGKLIFTNAKLEDVLKKVSDTYGVDFEYNNSKTKDLLITGTIPTSNLEICLKAIKKSINVTIKKENSILVVYKN